MININIIATNSVFTVSIQSLHWVITDSLKKDGHGDWDQLKVFLWILEMLASLPVKKILKN